MRLFLLLFTFISLTTFADIKKVEDFGNNPGNLSLFTYIPSSVNNKTPIVILNHGCTQNAVDYARQSGWLKVAKTRDFILLSPEQSIENNDKLCFRWFEQDHYRKDSGEQASIISMLKFIKKKFNLNSNVYVTGISAGGATTSNLIGNYPELFEAAAVVAGVHYRCASNLNSAIACMYTPLIEDFYTLRKKVSLSPLTKIPRVMVVHGLADKTVNAINSTNTISQWLSVNRAESQFFNPMNYSHFHNRFEQNYYKNKSHILKAVTFYSLDHAQPIDESSGCGQSAEYISDNGYCASSEIADFFNL